MSTNKGQARLSTVAESSLSSDTLGALEPARQGGKLAEVYLQFANSQPALRAYLHMEQSLREGALDLATLESIKLRISQLTGCEHCLAIHTFKARQAGLDKDTQLLVRQGLPTGDALRDALLALANHLFHTPGRLPDELLQTARGAGASDEQLVDLTMAMATIFFTNLTNHINDSQASLPPAPPLPQSAAPDDGHA